MGPLQMDAAATRAADIAARTGVRGHAEELRDIARTLVLHYDHPVQRDAAIVALLSIADEVGEWQRTAVAHPGPLPEGVVSLSAWRGMR